MTQGDFNSRLENLLSVPMTRPADPQWIVGEIMRRDQLRTRVLAALSIFFWLAGTAGMMVMVVGLNELVIYIRIAHFAVAGPETRPGESFSPEVMRMLDMTNLIHHSMPWIGGSVIASMLAALFTVLLVFSSRRATLNRINFSLMQISELLRQMRDAETKKAGNP